MNEAIIKYIDGTNTNIIPNYSKTFLQLLWQHVFFTRNTWKWRVNFTNILWAHLHQFSYTKRSSNIKCKYKKALRKTFVQKQKVAAHGVPRLIFDDHIFDGQFSDGHFSDKAHTFFRPTIFPTRIFYTPKRGCRRRQPPDYSRYVALAGVWSGSPLLGWIDNLFFRLG